MKKNTKKRIAKNVKNNADNFRVNLEYIDGHRWDILSYLIKSILYNYGISKHIEFKETVGSNHNKNIEFYIKNIDGNPVFKRFSRTNETDSEEVCCRKHCEKSLGKAALEDLIGVIRCSICGNIRCQKSQDCSLDCDVDKYPHNINNLFKDGIDNKD
jgi:hypothetical protein